MSVERIHKGNSLIEFPENYVIIDIETTGLCPNYDEIIEIGALKIVNGIVIERFQSLIQPERLIDEFIEQLTGITNEMLSEAPSIETVLPKFLKFVDNNIVIGHNVHFDVNFIYDNTLKFLNTYFSNDFVDTLRLSRLLTKDIRHHRLNDMAEYFSIDAEKAHRSIADCGTTNLLLEHLKAKAISDFGSIEFFVKSRRKAKRPIRAQEMTALTLEFDESNLLFGKSCVFTGVLEKMTRKQAMQCVLDIGGKIENSVTKNTNYLILGNNDYCSTIKDGKSNKQKKAEEYKLKGLDIEIIPESVFYELLTRED